MERRDVVAVMVADGVADVVVASVVVATVVAVVLVVVVVVVVVVVGVVAVVSVVAASGPPGAAARAVATPDPANAIPHKRSQTARGIATV
jgi:hypothetical protein